MIHTNSLPHPQVGSLSPHIMKIVVLFLYGKGDVVESPQEQEQHQISASPAPTALQATSQPLSKIW